MVILRIFVCLMYVQKCAIIWALICGANVGIGSHILTNQIIWSRKDLDPITINADGICIISCTDNIHINAHGNVVQSVGLVLNKDQTGNETISISTVSRITVFSACKSRLYTSGV